MGDIFVQAAEDMGYPKTDLNAPFAEGRVRVRVHLMQKKNKRNGSDSRHFPFSSLQASHPFSCR
jgi:hypothetical protein